MKAVLKVGGFLFSSDPKLELFSKYKELVTECIDKGYQLLIVTGGGITARKYIEMARSEGSTENVCDELGILASRLNALLLIASLQDLAYPDIPQTLTEVKRFYAIGKPVVMGGLQPGQSTNAVAALAAEAINADLLINATNVDGVYTEDPKKNPHAKMLKMVTSIQLEEILKNASFKAGGYPLFDPLAIKVVARSHLPTWIVNGLEVLNIKAVLNGEEVGTRIVYTS